MITLNASRRRAGCLSDFLFDQFMSSDLSASSAAEDVRAHLASCYRCRNRLAELEAIEAPPFEDLFAQSLKRKSRRNATRLAIPAMALAAAAALVIGVREKRNAEAPAVTRSKGVLSLDLVRRGSSGEVTRPAQGEAVFPGDALRFEVTAARAGFVTVLGLDAAGAVTVYAPTSESTFHLEAGAPTVLPGSVVADETLGPERIVALHCAKPSSLDELQAAARRALSQAGGNPLRVKELGTPCSETSFIIDKRERP